MNLNISTTYYIIFTNIVLVNSLYNTTTLFPSHAFLQKNKKQA